jgi:dissimilatory sulfite reductase (desulfoviridin) alpha/beta subunit
MVRAEKPGEYPNRHVGVLSRRKKREYQVQVRFLSLRMTDKEKLEEILDLAASYAGVEGGHHKQYALVEIVKVVLGDKFDAWYAGYLGTDENGDNIYSEWEPGIP